MLLKGREDADCNDQNTRVALLHSESLFQLASLGSSRDSSAPVVRSSENGD